MASASEQLASNMNLSAFGKAKELQQRLLFTLMILVVYRIGTYVPIPGIDLDKFQSVFANGGGGLLGRLNMFAGGAVERLAIFALNVMPYISASIIMTLMKGSLPSLKELDKDGEQGRKQINQYTRYLTVFLAAFQAFGISRALGAQGVVLNPGFFFDASTVPATAGSIFANGGPGWLTTMLAYIGYGSPVYLTLYGLLIIFFCYFYVPYVFKPEDVADNLRKNGGFLPGIRPGARTAEYLTYVLSRLTFIGAIYVAFVCVLPEYIIAQNKQIPPSVAMLVGGMSLLIMVSVTLDTVAQIQSHLIAHQYEGLIKKSKMRRRKK